MDIFAMYLRKSRTDEQAEARGEGDVLARHRKTLTELAAHNKDIIAEEYAEVGSADSISARKEMQRLLMDVLSGKYAGVYCMDIDRLSRGDAADQATIIRTFQASDTIVRTPGRDYDFNKEADEDFGEMKLYFGRFEYKTIKRRLYKGRERSAGDGCYIGTRIPYGYSKVPAQGRNGPTLAVIPDQAETVRDMFRMYADGKSSYYIADVLNARGIKPNYSDYWSPSTIRGILKNPLYIGKITWGKRVKRPITGADGVKRVINQRAIVSEGKHAPIVSEALWASVTALFDGHSSPTVKAGKPLENPLAGLVRCARCGSVMQRQQDKVRPDILRCHNRQCDQMRGDLATVESMILKHLDSYFDLLFEKTEIQTQTQRKQERERAAKLIRDQIRQAEAQQSRQADLLEQGIYSNEEFIARRNVLSERLTGLRRELAEVLEPDMYEERLAELRKAIPHSMTISEAYRKAATPAEKNALLKSVIESVKYNKTERRQGKNDSKARGITLEFKLLF